MFWQTVVSGPAICCVASAPWATTSQINGWRFALEASSKHGASRIAQTPLDSLDLDGYHHDAICWFPRPAFPSLFNAPPTRSHRPRPFPTVVPFATYHRHTVPVASITARCPIARAQRSLQCLGPRDRSWRLSDARCTSNQVVSGVLVLSMIVPAVTDVWWRQVHKPIDPASDAKVFHLFDKPDSRNPLAIVVVPSRLVHMCCHWGTFVRNSRYVRGSRLRSSGCLHEPALVSVLTSP